MIKKEESFSKKLKKPDKIISQIIFYISLNFTDPKLQMEL